MSHSHDQDVNAHAFRNVLVLLFLIIAPNLPSGAQVLNLDESFTAGVGNAPAMNKVSAIQPDGKILVGGYYRLVNGSEVRGVVRLNADGTSDETFNTGGSGSNGTVFDIVVLSDGKILIGGSFTSYDGTPVKGLARLNSDGTLDLLFNPGGSGVFGPGSGNFFEVRSIAIQSDGKIVVAGQSIAGYNGVPNKGIFRVNEDGTLDASFVSGFANLSSIEEIALQADGKIVIGMDNTDVYNGVNVRPLLRINADASLDTAFSSAVLSGNGPFYAVTVQSDGRILIGGGFGSYNGTTRRGIARVNANGSLDTTFVPQNLTSAIIEHVVVQANGQILASGSVNSDSTYNESLVRFNSDGSRDQVFDRKTDGYGYHVAPLSDGRLVLTGDFSRIPPGENRNAIIVCHSDGSVDTSFNASIAVGGWIDKAYRQTDGKLIVAGSFTKANDSGSLYVARFNADGTVDDSFSVGSGPLPVYNVLTGFPQINAIAAQSDGKILLAGRFRGFNESSRAALVRLNIDGSIDTDFNISGISPLFIVNDVLPLESGKLIIAAGGIGAGGVGRTIVRLNSDGSYDPTFNSGFASTNPGTVDRTILQPDGKIIISGTFSSYNGVSRSSIARINADGSLDTSFVPGRAGGSIVELQGDGKILAVNNSSLLFRYNSNGVVDSSFSEVSQTGGQFRSVAIQSNGKVLASGRFTQVNGVPRIGLARLNADGSLDSTFIGGFDNVDDPFYKSVNSMQYGPDGLLYVGGEFSRYGQPRMNLLRLIDNPQPSPTPTNTPTATPTNTPTATPTSTPTATPTSTPPSAGRRAFDYDADGKTDISVFRPSSGAWYLQRSRDGLYGLLFGLGDDRITPADYDGDGKADIAVYRPSTGIWYVLQSSDGTVVYSGFGIAEDLPTPADYDGDGKADISVFRPSTATWYRQNSSDGSFYAFQFGLSEDRPTIGDFDGDNKADIAVFRPSTGAWYQINSSDGSLFGEIFGFGSDVIIPADYDGDGKSDLAVFRPSNGFWYIKNSNGAVYTAFQFGLSEDIPTPGDYDGDGKADLSVFRPSDGNWYRTNSSNGSFFAFQFGTDGDKPTQTAFRY